MIILLLWSLLLPWLLGFALISLLNKYTQPLPLYQKISLAFLLGTGIFTMFLFILSLLGFSWNREWISITIGLPSILSIFLKNWKHKLDHIPRLTIRWNLFNVILLGIILFKLVTIFYLALDKPITDWDAWANWSLRAKVFYFEKGIPLNQNAPYYLGGGGHINYPLQIPILEAWVYTTIGQWNDQVVKVIFPLYCTFFLLFLYSFLSQRIGSTKALLFSFLFITLPFVSYHAASAYVDLPVGIYVGVATMLLWTYFLKRQIVYMILFSLVFSFAGWIKNEGLLLFIITSFFLLCILLWEKFRENENYTSKKTIAACAVGIIVLLPWILFKLIFGLGISNFGENEVFSHILTVHYEILPILLKNFTTSANFSLLLPLFLFGILAYWKDLSKEKLFYFVLLNIMYLITYLGVYLLTQNYLFILDGTIFQRNLLTIIPSIFWVSALIYGTTVHRSNIFDTREKIYL